MSVSNSYFRPNAWRETETAFIHVERDWHSLLAEILTHFRMITLLLLLLVEDVVGLGGISEVFGCCPQDFCMLSWMRGASPKQLGRLLGSQRSFTNKTFCFIIQQYSVQFPSKYRLLQCKSIKDIPRRGQWKAHLFFFFKQTTTSNFDLYLTFHFIQTHFILKSFYIKYMILSRFS